MGIQMFGTVNQMFGTLIGPFTPDEIDIRKILVDPESSAVDLGACSATSLNVQ